MTAIRPTLHPIVVARPELSEQDLMSKARIYHNEGRWHSQCACGLNWSGTGDYQGWEFARIQLYHHMLYYCLYFSKEPA